MPKFETCFRCGGPNLERGKIDAPRAPGNGGVVFVAENARILTLASSLPVEAYFCTDCGSIELVADPAGAKKHLRPTQE
jgi:hypothetical protein